MLAYITEHTLHYGNMLVLDVLPWWAWLLIGVAAFVAATLLIPAPKVNTAVGTIALVVCFSIGMKSWGFQQGQADERAVWVAQVAAEKERLAKGFQKDDAQEQATEAAAATMMRKLNQEREDATVTAVDPNGNPATPHPGVIPPDFAAKLRAMGGSGSGNR